jgi:hypothetical protein
LRQPNKHGNKIFINDIFDYEMIKEESTIPDTHGSRINFGKAYEISLTSPILTKGGNGWGQAYQYPTQDLMAM